MIIKMDLANAFGSALRGATAMAVARRAPQLMPLLRNEWDTAAGTTIWVRGSEEWECFSAHRGILQGSPISKLYFAILLEDTMAAQALREGSGVETCGRLAFVDDVSLIGPQVQVVDRQSKCRGKHSIVLIVFGVLHLFPTYSRYFQCVQQEGS